MNATATPATPATIKVRFTQWHGPIAPDTIIACVENKYGLIVPANPIPYAVRWPSFTMAELYNGHDKVRPIRTK